MPWSIDQFNKKLDHLALEQKTRVYDKFAELGADANSYMEAVKEMKGTQKTPEESEAEIIAKLQQYEANAKK